VGEARDIVLRATRLEVSNFEKSLTRADLLRIPRPLRERLWLLDLDLSGSETQPKLFDYAIDALRERPLDDPGLSDAERNLIVLLNMSPELANLEGTSIEPLLALSEKLGFAPAALLADALDVPVDAPFLSRTALKAALLSQVVQSHPNAQTRPGGTDDAHPDGRWPVSPGALPIFLEDVLTDMATLSSRFGPVQTEGAFHPGFLVGPTRAQLLGDDFRLSVRVRLNALPFQGIDLDQGAMASVNSVGAEPLGMFDFADPNWLALEGLVPSGPIVTEMTFALADAPGEPVSATQLTPWPTGDGTVWGFAPYALESVVTHAALAAWSERSTVRDYFLGPNPSPVATLTLERGWFSAVTKGDVGPPPPPTYIWDLIREVAARRLRDGVEAPTDEPLELQFRLQNVPAGLTNAQVVQASRQNLERDPSGLIAAARYLFSNAQGAADFFYLRAPNGTHEDEDGDWLAFVAPTDIELDADGAPVRDYAGYAQVGFFRDRGLTEPVAELRRWGGGEWRWSVRIEEGQTLYCADDAGRVYRLAIGTKPGKFQCSINVTRLE
jgi:hypothetical protein